MDDALPIRYTQAFNLADLGLSKELFKPGNLGFESEKYISLKDGGVSCFMKFKIILKRFFLGSNTAFGFKDNTN
jgi:hypothetical protein